MKQEKRKKICKSKQSEPKTYFRFTIKLKNTVKDEEIFRT